MKTADLSDHFPDVQVCESVFRSFGGRTLFHGPIRTIRCFEDFALVRQLLGENGSGAILVIDGGGSMRRALLGDLLTRMGVDNGWTGIVINGPIRDSAEIGNMPIGVMATGTTPLRSFKEGQGETGVPVSFAGAEFSPGDYLYADKDGVLVSAHPLSLPDKSG